MLLIRVAATINRFYPVRRNAAGFDDIGLDYVQNLLARSPSLTFRSVGNFHAPFIRLVLDLDGEVIEVGSHVTVAKLSKLVEPERLRGSAMVLCRHAAPNQ